MRTTKYGSNMVIISPNLVKKFATGKGGADKAAMVEAMPESLVDEIKEANYKKTTGLYDKIGRASCRERVSSPV